MVCTQVLSISSIILGVYIIGVMLYGEKEKVIQQNNHYHLGCFLTAHNLSQSWMIEKSMQQSLAKVWFAK